MDEDSYSKLISQVLQPIRTLWKQSSGSNRVTATAGGSCLSCVILGAICGERWRQDRRLRRVMTLMRRYCRHAESGQRGGKDAGPRLYMAVLFRTVVRGILCQRIAVVVCVVQQYRLGFLRTYGAY